jgi:hypothetical protein
MLILSRIDSFDEKWRGEDVYQTGTNSDSNTTLSRGVYLMMNNTAKKKAPPDSSKPGTPSFSSSPPELLRRHNRSGPEMCK